MPVRLYVCIKLLSVTCPLICDRWERDIVKRRNYSRRFDIYGNVRIVLAPLLHFLHEFILINEHRSKEVAFADDLMVAGNIKEIK